MRRRRFIAAVGTVTFLAVVGAAEPAGCGRQTSVKQGSALYPRLPLTTASRTLYVSTTGNDATGTGSRTRPYASIAAAFYAASPAGTRIVVRGGVFRQQVYLDRRSFSTSNPLTIENASGETVRLLGADGDALNIHDVRGLRIRGGVGGGSLHLQHALRSGLRINNGSKVEILRLAIHNNGDTGVYVGGYPSSGSGYPSSGTVGSVDVDIYSSSIFENGARKSGTTVHGVYYGGGQGATRGVIANNLVRDQHTGYGIQLGQTLNGTIVANNTVDGADDPAKYAGNGIQIDSSQGGPFQNVAIVNNLSTNNGSSATPTPEESGRAIYGVSRSVLQAVVARNNLGFNNRAGPRAEFDNVHGTHPGVEVFRIATNRHGDPRYVDREGKDFHLSAGSSALGISDPAYTPLFDHDGRPRSGRLDLGCYERP